MSVAEGLTKNTTLQKLDLSGNPIPGNALKMWAQYLPSGFANLVSLDLSDNELLEDTGIIGLINGLRTNLVRKGSNKEENQHSYLMDKNRPTTGIKLIELNLKNTNMTDDSAKLLLDLILEGQAKTKKKKNQIYPWSLRRLNCDLNTVSKKSLDQI